MARQGNDGSPPSLWRSLHPERLLLIGLLVITTGFAISYARLFYELRQARAEQEALATRVRQEEIRKRDLETMKTLSEQDRYREAEVARLLGPRVTSEGDNSPQETAAASEDTPPVATTAQNIPIWQQWLETFHISVSGRNRSPE